MPEAPEPAESETSEADEQPAPMTQRAPDEYIELGAAAPEFALPDVVTGDTVSPADMADKDVLVVIVMCRHCPYVKHVLPGLVEFGNDYGDKSVGIVGISANDADKYEQDSPESLKEMAEQVDLPFPLLYDESQQVVTALTATATPEFYVFDEDRKLRYHGQFDDTRPGGDAPTGEDVRQAVDALLAGVTVSADQTPAVGCSIKWKPGNRPPYVK